MQVTIVLLLTAALAAAPLVAQEKPAAKGEPKEKAAAEAKKEAAPAKDGRTYVEKRTPLGTMKIEAKSEVSEPVVAPANVRAFDEGDTVRFERKTPFGAIKWTRKKSELDEVERAVWERDCKKPADAQPAKK